MGLGRSTLFEAAGPVAAGQEVDHRSIRVGRLAVLLVAPWLAVSDGFVTIIAAPSIQHQLAASDGGIRLIVAARPVAYAALLVTGGRLGDVHGRRRVLILGLTLFSLSSLLASSAPDQTVLAVARVLQGISAAVMYPQALALIRVAHTTAQTLATAMAAWGATLGLASGTAMLLGGLILQANILSLGWRCVFFINIPIGLGAALAAWRLLPPGRTEGKPGLDVVGVVLLTAALFGLVLPLAAHDGLDWPASSVALLAGAGVIGLVFVVHERRLAAGFRSPLVEVHLFGVRIMLVGLAATVALYGGQLSTWLLLTLYLQRAMRMTPLASGMAFTPVAMGLLAASICAARLTAPSRQRAFALGAVGLAASVGGLGAFAFVEGGRLPIPVLLADLLLVGAGFGLTVPTLAAALLAAAPANHEGAASGLMVTAQQVAGALGVAVTGIVLSELAQPALRLTSASALGLTLVSNVLLFLAAAALGRHLP